MAPARLVLVNVLRPKLHCPHLTEKGLRLLPDPSQVSSTTSSRASRVAASAEEGRAPPPLPPSRPQRRTAPLRPDVAAPGRGQCPFSAAQARGLREQSSRPGAQKSSRWPPSTAVGAPLWRPFAPLSPHCRPRPLPPKSNFLIFLSFFLSLGGGVKIRSSPHPAPEGSSCRHKPLRRSPGPSAARLRPGGCALSPAQA